MYVSDVAARDAFANRSMFNVVDPESGWKVDLIVRRLRPFSEQEFARRQSVDFFGVRLHVATVEDVMLSKLEWASLHGDEIDGTYLRRWIDALAVGSEWEAAQQMLRR